MVTLHGGWGRYWYQVAGVDIEMCADLLSTDKGMRPFDLPRATLCLSKVNFLVK